MAVKIKICGLTKIKEVKMLADNMVDFAGLVLFYEKSKRNNTIENAKLIMNELKKTSIKTVAVVVSPDKEQVTKIEKMGFDYIQIHGILKSGVFEKINIPILRAFNISSIDNVEQDINNSKVAGYVFDAAIPGSGKTFDWSLTNNIERNDKLFILAGGLSADNVHEAVQQVKPDIVDVSSGVETDAGKDLELIVKFVNEARK